MILEKIAKRPLKNTHIRTQYSETSKPDGETEMYRASHPNNPALAFNTYRVGGPKTGVWEYRIWASRCRLVAAGAKSVVEGGNAKWARETLESELKRIFPFKVRMYAKWSGSLCSWSQFEKEIR